MKKIEIIEEEMIENLTLMTQFHRLLNQILEKSNEVDKNKAYNLLGIVNQEFKVEIKKKEEEIDLLKNVEENKISPSSEEKECRQQRMERFLEEAQNLKEIMLLTGKYLKKYFPLKDLNQGLKKNRNRLRKMKWKLGENK